MAKASTLLTYCVVLLEVGTAWAGKLHGNKLEALLLKAGDDFTHETALNAANKQAIRGAVELFVSIMTCTSTALRQWVQSESSRLRSPVGLHHNVSPLGSRHSCFVGLGRKMTLDSSAALFVTDCE